MIDKESKKGLTFYKDSNTIFKEISNKKLKRKDRGKTTEQLLMEHMENKK